MEGEIRQIREAKRLLGKASKAISSASWHTRTAVDCVESVTLPMTVEKCIILC